VAARYHLAIPPIPMKGGSVPFPQNLRRLRLERFFSQAELGRRAHVHAVTIARLEAGVWPPTMRTVRQLAEALGVNPLELASPDEVAQREKEAA
jgi:transcriptional regulator with XRE-family HTH domain